MSPPDAPGHASARAASLEIVVLATADWDNPLWTNKQHLASRWGKAGHRVLYIESVGLRRPQLARRDLRRMWDRLRRAHRLKQVEPSVWVLSPMVVPFHGFGAVRRINRRILRRRTARALRRIGMSRPVLWTYNPLALQLFADLSWGALIYHCVDELAGSPRMPVETLERAERELCGRADLVVVSAPTLAEEKRGMSRRLEYVPNVADFQTFSRATDPETRVPSSLAAIPGPRIGFVGAISNYKLNLEMLEEVFRRHPAWNLVMIGPVGGGDPGTRVDDLKRLPNVHFLGTRRQDELPGYLKGFDACLLPNRLNRYSRYMFPLKFFEYLASGKPVVMTPLPSLAEYRHLAYVSDADDPASYARALERALEEPADAAVRQERIEEARKHDWNAQAERLSGMVRELVGASRGPRRFPAGDPGRPA